MKKLLLLMAFFPFSFQAMDNQEEEEEHTIRVEIYRTGPNGRVNVATFSINQTPTLTFKQIASAIKEKYQINGTLWFHYSKNNQTLLATDTERLVARFNPETYTLYFDVEPLTERINLQHHPT